jgi:putative cell wall-binding protein
MTPSLDGWPNAIRLSGANRYQTGLTAALTLRGEGGPPSYPYGSPDPGTTDGWFGLDSCPRAIIVVAGDNPADALAATPLSDPTGESSEPYLSISASADQVFDPIGDFRRVDTDFAPILTTTSTRQGATSLNVATRLAAQDLRSGGCTTAREAIVVGGTSAVPASVDTELVSIGYDRVYRVAGSSRYHTAQLVATALGTAATPTGVNQCADAVVNDGSARMDFYANSVVEYRTGAISCTLLERTAVLADGIVGADALAAGWWTSYWQVPMLLHNGTEELPSATRQALQTLGVDNVIVLGGTGRISNTVVDEIESVTSATVTRVSGADRYATSVKMAEVFGGWFDSSSGSDFAGSKVCVAASSGGSSSNAGSGWADALAAGPWCARSTASNIDGPVRALSPSNGSNPVTTSAQSLLRPAREAVPVLLVPAGFDGSGAAALEFLSERFGSVPCSSASAAPGCTVPGFAVVFGGTSLIDDTGVLSLSNVVAGNNPQLRDERSPELDSAFVTSLDLSPVYATGSSAGQQSVCVQRSDYGEARWLSVAGPTISATTDLMTSRSYVVDADGVARTPGVGGPVCMAIPTGRAVEAWVTGLAGFRSPGVTFATGSTEVISMSSTVSATSPVAASGVDSANDQSAGGSTTWTFESLEPVQLTVAGEVLTVTKSAISLTLSRGRNTASTAGPDLIEGTFSLFSGTNEIVGALEGEAIWDGSAWKARGRTVWTTLSAVGGFSVDLSSGPSALLDDDGASWRLDGLIS